jgi:hypothetical protein
LNFESIRHEDPRVDAKCKICADKGWYSAGDKEIPRPCIWCDEGLIYAQSTSKMILERNGRRYLQLDDAIVEVPGKRPYEGQSIKEWHEAKRKFLAGEFECAHMFSPHDNKCDYCKRSVQDVYDEMYPNKPEIFKVRKPCNHRYHPLDNRCVFCHTSMGEAIEVWRKGGPTPDPSARNLSMGYVTPVNENAVFETQMFISSDGSVRTTSRVRPKEKKQWSADAIWSLAVLLAFIFLCCAIGVCLAIFPVSGV